MDIGPQIKGRENTNNVALVRKERLSLVFIE